jgi:hypothetical protein
MQGQLTTLETHGFVLKTTADPAEHVRFTGGSSSSRRHVAAGATRSLSLASGGRPDPAAATAASPRTVLRRRYGNVEPCTLNSEHSDPRAVREDDGEMSPPRAGAIHGRPGCFRSALRPAVAAGRVPP